VKSKNQSYRYIFVAQGLTSFSLATGYIRNTEIMEGIRKVGKGSWKKREVGKSEIEKFLVKLERAKRSWKEPSEVEKF